MIVLPSSMINALFTQIKIMLVDNYICVNWRLEIDNVINQQTDDKLRDNLLCSCLKRQEELILVLIVRTPSLT